jgi:uracil-DNA glycosylase family 4
MQDAAEYHRLRAMLDWQVELGATEAIGDVPVDRYAVAARMPVAAQGVAPAAPVAPRPSPAGPAAMAIPPGADPVALAQQAAAACADLGELRAAMEAYEHCELKRGARQLVFADGTPGAPLMVVGEAPGRDEDRIGRPFVGPAGQLLDRMLAAIGRDRADPDPARAVYITNVLPWRPPENRDPTPEEIAMLRPFLRAHVRMARPRVLLLLGNHSCQALLGRRGITRLRGSFTEAEGLPALPSFHPSFLLRQPAEKRLAWADLLALQARLRET